tara:strand:+ start:13 stop:252 length:240 start_codon:yes stop_codon:yes gene_type:complete
MTLSKKHYIQIAKILLEEFEEAYINDELYRNDHRKSTTTVASMYHKLVDYFEHDDPNFNRDVFEKATTMTEARIKELNK